MPEELILKTKTPVEIEFWKFTKIIQYENIVKWQM